MKQFLHVDDITQSFIVALKDRAFCCGPLAATRSTSETTCWIFELLPPSLNKQKQTGNTQDNPNKKNDDYDDKKEHEEIIGSLKNNNINSSINEERNDDENNPEASSSDHCDNAVDAGFGNNNPNEIQAVAIFSYDNDPTINNERFLWCAVTRYDKSLSVYRIQPRKNNEDSTTSTFPRQLAPTIVHNTSKRAGSLCFAIVPQPTSFVGRANVDCTNVTNSNEHGRNRSKFVLPVVIAGDLSGDAVAFSLESYIERKRRSDEISIENEPTDIVDKNESEDEDEHKVASRNKRLLLGHTASMLTGVQVVHNSPPTSQNDYNQQQFIITSDRDEKIRISSFPDTHIILGYLLGHTSFISCIDCCTTKTRCVSLSGDQTLRLWDYKSFKQLASTSWGKMDNSKKRVASTVDANTTIATTSNQVSCNNNDVDNNNEHGLLAPCRVAINSLGDVVASIYEDCTCIDIWSIRESIDPDVMNNNNNKETELEIHNIVYKYDIGVQPLSIQFYGKNKILVLCCDPIYVLILTIHNNNNNNNATIAVDDTTVICKQLQNVAIQYNICMPVSLLERDPRNHKMKLEKLHEERGGSRTKPWNDVSRRDTDKERKKRMRINKRQNRKK